MNNYLSKEQIFGMYQPEKAIYQNKVYDVSEINFTEGGIWFYEHNSKQYISECTLILRPMSDMTDSEITQFVNLGSMRFQQQFENKNFNSLRKMLWSEYNILQIQYLISIGMDVFDAIELGWAIRKSEAGK